MTGEWMAGIVESSAGDGPPTVEEWVPVDVPGRPAQFGADDGPIAYRTTIEDPRTHEDERTFLRLDGAYGRTDVWINGHSRGRHEAHFLPARIEFAPRPENEVVAVCRSPDAFAGIYGTDEVPPELAVPGIWWDTAVEVTPQTFIRDLSVSTRISGDETILDADIVVDAGEPIDDAITLSLRPEGFRGGGSMERQSFEADAGERVTVSKEVRVRDPSFWWPREHGPQHRYTLRAKLGDDAIERTVGLRQVERTSDGLFVNGTRVPARGVTRLPGESPTEDVRRAIDANSTIIRARGHVPPHEFYEACDEAGLLVWQDLPHHGPDLDVESGSQLANALASEYGYHPSIAMYGVQDEPVTPFDSPLGTGLRAKLAFRWRAWRTSFDDAAATEVATAFPDDIPVVPVSGQPGTGADATHLFPGWQYLEATDIEWLLDRYPHLGTVVGGFGAGSLTADRDGDVPGLDSAVLVRHASGVEQSQAYQASTLKTVAEALRRRGTGIMTAGTLRDTAPGGGMGTLKADGTTKPAYDALAESYEPIQAVLEQPAASGTVPIVLLNDTNEPVEASVSWSAGANTGEMAGSVGPLDDTTIGEADVPSSESEVRLEVQTGDRIVTNTYRR